MVCVYVVCVYVVCVYVVCVYMWCVCVCGVGCGKSASEFLFILCLSNASDTLKVRTD